MPELLLETVHRLRGGYPDIPLPDDIDKAELGEFFVTLPIGRVNARSRNRRTYVEKAVRRIVSEVNEKRPIGHWGHPDEEQRAERAPVVRWLAATLDDKGIAWGKLVPLTEDAREFLRVARATRSAVGNSLYGDAVMDGERVVDLSISYIDLVANSQIVGVPDTAATPVITKETTTNQESEDTNPVPPEFNEQLITELRSDRDTARTRIGELERQVAELQPAAAQMAALRTLITEQADVFTSAGITINASGPDFIQVIREMITKLQNLQVEKLRSQLDSIVTEMVKVEKLRPVIAQLLGSPKNEVEARQRVSELLEQPYVKDLAQALVREAAGPNAFAPGGNANGNWKDRYDDKYGQEEAKRRGVVK
jgi:hypothetical protein